MGTPKTKFSTIALERVSNGGTTLIREPPTQFLFESGLDDDWDNDLIMIHNPFARNPVKEFLFPTWYEYRCTVDEKEHKFTVTEIHPKNS